MKKNIIKNEKGVTLMVLMLTIVTLAILAGFAIRNMDTGIDIRNYNYMCADIELLESKIMVYYNEYNYIPIRGTAFNAKSMLNGQGSSRDNDNYYEIDISQLQNITLYYGGGTVNDKNVYIINEQSHEVYYLQGTVYENATYYKER